jgi:hypothetical protein
MTISRETVISPNEPESRKATTDVESKIVYINITQAGKSTCTYVSNWIVHESIHIGGTIHMGLEQKEQFDILAAEIMRLIASTDSWMAFIKKLQQEMLTDDSPKFPQ